MSIIDFFRKDKVSTLLEVIHPDIKDLIWIKNGKYKNYDRNDASFKARELESLAFHNLVKIDLEDSMRIDSKVSSNVMKKLIQEPSLIDVFLSLSKPKYKAQPLPYSPSYEDLYPEQRWTYLEFLKNPYDDKQDIGYVFLLYYGLERHLLFGKKEKAIDVILKLRDVHKNKSFQKYSAGAIILSSIKDKNVENIKKFLLSLDKEHEFLFSDNLYLICASLFDIPLNSWDIIRMAKTFDFTNQSYIKKYPEIFYKHLENVLLEHFDKNMVSIHRYLDTDELSKLPFEKTMIFINSTLIDLSISIVQICTHTKLKEGINALLQAAHDKTKKELIILRKEGVIEREPRKQPKKIEFDSEVIEKAFKEYKEKVAGFDEFEGMTDFDNNFSKYNEMMEKGALLEKTDISKAIATYLEILAVTTPIGSTYWERPMILLEKLHMYDKALFICNRASVIALMPHVNMGNFDARHARLKEKCSKLNNT